jgi:hypothetical protein
VTEFTLLAIALGLFSGSMDREMVQRKAKYGAGSAPAITSAVFCVVSGVASVIFLAFALYTAPWSSL